MSFCLSVCLSITFGGKGERGGGGGRCRERLGEGGQEGEGQWGGGI